MDADAVHGAATDGKKFLDVSDDDAASETSSTVPGDDAFERLLARAMDADAVHGAATDGKKFLDVSDDDAASETSSTVKNEDDFNDSNPSPRALCARWTTTARFGEKARARALLDRWARTIGAEAGIARERFEISSGYVGGKESTLEMTVRGFRGLGEVETFFARVPRGKHVEWGKAFATCVVDGSPEWVVMETRGVGVGVGGDEKGDADAARDAPAETETKTDYEDVDESALVPGTTLPDGRYVMMDWKGEPMLINPGDKMPRF
ncbi:unnamed product [Ostreococcus tauri]|uniref:Unnamed product n=1 Tax=Ostreococcus tauri TaxID=70448 RepID=A0A090M633_OSTTA|nr:unnamed product [Ostreococcus tauri]CEF99700.1 unnamed product [Ostreococcus tauri]|eukprot:XP_003082080.2 unnamed product [Ostreococcus tauri]